MLQILLDHFFRHLAYRGAEIPSCPKMPAPVSLLKVLKLLEQLARRSPFDSSHDLARRHVRRATHQNMYVILAHDALHDPKLKRFARLSHPLSHSI